LHVGRIGIRAPGASPVTSLQRKKSAGSLPRLGYSGARSVVLIGSASGAPSAFDTHHSRFRHMRRGDDRTTPWRQRTTPVHAI